MPAGTVTQFDDYVGLGEVTDVDGTVFVFHCVEIADGSRTIDVGIDVDFDVRVKFGNAEAARLRPRP
ncbi:MAG: hypothetical protein ACK5OX_08050 [Desertimonas sp.]